MIKQLNTPHGFEVWVNHKLAQEIEDAFKQALETETLNYYYISCPGQSLEAPCNHKHKQVWLGPIGIIEYIKKVQSKKFNAPVLGVTSCKSSGELKVYMNNEDLPLFPKQGESKDYWIGDIARDHHVICGDELFKVLWDRLASKVTKGAKTRKRGFF